MQWWSDFLGWLNSNDGGRIVSTVLIPFIAIVVAGVVAALIGRASARKVIELSEREVRASAVTALISAARKAAVWNTLPAPEQQHIDHLIGDSEIRLRLLPVAGTSLAADWAAHEIASMKRNAVSFSFQAEQSLLVFRDRLIAWQARPTRAKKLFKNDLDSWAYDSSLSEQELVQQQQAWAAQQVTTTGPIKTVAAPTLSRPPAAPIVRPATPTATAVAAPAATAVTSPASATSPVASAPVLAPTRGSEAAAMAHEPTSSQWGGSRPVASSPVEPTISSAPAQTASLTALDEPKDDSPRDIPSPPTFSKPESKAVEVEASAATEHGEQSGELDGDHQHGEGHHSDSNDDNDDTQQKHHDDNHQHQNQHEHEGWRD
ncbi:MAG: hypothetical protein JWM49_512 [Microbacteriaceae bacterium]|nr:hypothetical protein [Microbacteriaceae bacterium]